jgi:hypothetical protein
VLAQWADAPPAARPALIAALGRIGGAAALEKIRAARHAGAAELVDAAVRALAQWPTADVLEDLLDVAEHGESRTQRVLALGGYIRLLGLPSGREPQATAALYRTAWTLAERPDEKKQILSGLSEVPHEDALRLAQESLRDEDLRAEAQNAVISVARLIGPWEVETARTAINDVLAQTTEDATRERGQKALEAIDKAQGCILTWSVAGPYFENGQEWSDVLDATFPPEQADASVPWRPLKNSSIHQPWVFDLTPLDSGSNRCVYVRSAVWCAQGQDARLEVGSDDAVKVWLNGQLVHEFRAVRAHEPLQDHVAVKLQAGWNTLLLKVVQASGGWGFSAALRSPDGQPLTGLKFQADAPANP